MADNDTPIVSGAHVRADLTVTDSEGHTSTFPILKEQTVIGRDPSAADLVLEDPKASRRHAQITWTGTAYLVQDLQSTNGTLRNNEPLSAPEDLHPGDRITVGDTILTFAQPVDQQASDPVTTSDQDSPGRTTPSRIALNAATEANQRLGHENLGFISEQFGFVPSTPPPLQLPPGFEVWDDLAARLPELWRSISVRQALLELPVLDASEKSLPDEYLMRASVIISVLAHSYHRISAEAPEHPMPPGVQLPWEQISHRLDRLAPHLSYSDLILYNWKLIDPASDDPFALANLDLLVSTVDNQEEKVLYLMQVEAHQRTGAMLGAVVRAQEAVVANDVDALKQALITITDGVRRLSDETFMALNPNQHSSTFVEPVVWAKTVAPFAVPIAEGTVGPSGVGGPAFHMLDTFFGRVDYDTRLGHEMLQMRDWYPPHWQTFFHAVSEVSVGAFVEQSDDPVLKGVFADAAHSYAGDDGFLRRHMVKAYGYLDIAFKVGRSVTIGGFSGSFSDRVWDLAVDELTNSRIERTRTLPPSGHHASIKAVELINPDGNPDAPVKRVSFDISDTGIRYAPGDRCAVLPENSDELITKTLRALRATGDEIVTLTSEWRTAIGQRSGYENAITLQLRTLLKFGRIRPVDRATAKTLYAASHNGKLRRIIESRDEDQWELWDLVNLLSAAGFDPKRLWRVHPGEREHICRVVPMESFRMYSISSAMGRSSATANHELSLTIGRLHYQTTSTSPTTEESHAEARHGTTSTFLGQPVLDENNRARAVSLRIVHPSHFSLPADPAVPIVMFAGGTGVAPFRSFLDHRVSQIAGGENWLFVGTRAPSEFYYQSEFSEMAAAGRLHVRAAFSREPVALTFDADAGDTPFGFEPGVVRHIGDEMMSDGNAEALWHLLRKKEDGGAGAQFYVCGRTGFASSVMEALEAIMHRFYEGPEDQRDTATSTALYELVGEGRYMQDIFTTYTGPHQKSATAFEASEIVLRNNPVDGYWMVIDGRVYDMNRFGHLHPGGMKIIHAYAGMDGTAAYRKVLHHVNPEIDSMLGMYEIGVVRRLRFGQVWGTVIAPDGLRSMLLSDAYRTWIRFLYGVTEMQNAFQQDCAIRDQTIVGTDDPGSCPPIKLQYLLEAHDRFAAHYFEGTTGDTLDDLWAVTSGFCSSTSDVRWMRDQIAQVKHNREAEIVRRISAEIQRRIDDLVTRGGDESDPAAKLVQDFCALLHAEDNRYLSEMKMVLREGVKVFEEFETDTIKLGGDQLMEAVQRIPAIVSSYHARVLSGFLGLWLDHPTVH